MQRLTFDDGEGMAMEATATEQKWEAKATFKHPVIAEFAKAMVDFFHEQGGTNFVEMEFMGGDPPERFRLTVQRAAGEMPAAKCARLEKELEALKGQ